MRLLSLCQSLPLLLLAWIGSSNGAMASLPQGGGGAAPLHLEKGDTICLMGGVLAERMQNHGWLELRLQQKFNDKELSVRNLGFGGDELTVHQRTNNFGKFTADGLQMELPNEQFVPWDRYLDHCEANVILAFFGYNESFAGADGIEDYKANLKSFIDHVQAQDYGGQGRPQLVLFSSIPHEDHGDQNLPDGTKANERIALYNAAAQAVAADSRVLFVDVFASMQARYAASEEPLTINGIHLNDAGNRELAQVIAARLYGGGQAQNDAPELLQAIRAKNHLWFNRYRATDGFNVYGGRSRMVYAGSVDGVPYSNFEVLQRELDHIDGLVAEGDREIWDLANGREYVADMSDVLPLMPVQTNKRGGADDGSHLYFDSEESLDQITAAKGLRVELFADEALFPELVNPVQMAFDTKGRLWVATWQTYPHWIPGQPMDDKLIILEDTNGDGTADKSTVFADDLHNPTGFEFWNGGVLVANAPNLLFLRDTDGDDHYDEKEILLHSLSSADTHHGANSFVLGPDGAVYFQEGTFHMSQVESIYGPIRNRNGCVWRFDPRTWEVERYIPYNYANPHGHVFDKWGQDFMTDGTGNVNYYSLPFSGFLPQPLKHSSYFAFFPQRSRPAGGTEFLSSSHFPEEYQGNYLIANVIGFRGVFNYEMKDDNSGFGADEQEPLVQSTEMNFRPVDLEVGPDGAVYFLDWHNALIGHLQHHLRDPSRDARHGRVYRVVAEGRELLEPVAIDGQPIPALLQLLKSPEYRVRYRARIELSEHDSDKVKVAVTRWVRKLAQAHPDYEHHLLESLWLLQQHNRMDTGLLSRLSQSKDPRARAAATRVVRYGRALLPDALDRIAKSAQDENPRVRLEAVVAASFFRGAKAADAALKVLEKPTDKFINYALGETMRALEEDWKAALRGGEPLAAGNPAGIEFLLKRVGSKELVHLPRVASVCEALLTRPGIPVAERLQAAGELAQLNGTGLGETVLGAMHKLDAEGGAQLADVFADLASLVRGLRTTGDGPGRDEMKAFAENSTKTASCAAGYALLIESDGSTGAALASAEGDAKRLLGLLKAVPMIDSEELRREFHGELRNLMFNPPSGVAIASPGTGLEVSIYRPNPVDARRETLEGLSPQEELHAETFTIKLKPALESSTFGVAFRGMLFAPKTGSYTFSTTSDDGSRLYIGDRCVVDNDGPHGALKASGEIDLVAGAHPILVTFFESGGAESLVVKWSGPGFKEQEIPASALGTGVGTRIQEAAIQAMALVPDVTGNRLSDVAMLLDANVSWESSLKLLGSVEPKDATPDQVRPVLALFLPRAAELALQERTTPFMESTLAHCAKLAARLPGAEGTDAVRELEALGGTRIALATLPHQMLYDLEEFWVEAGRPVTIDFRNNDSMPHNLVITLPGAMEVVGKAAEMLDGSSAGGGNAYVPKHGSVLWSTDLVLPGQTVSLTFTAPDEPGEHPYVCTYPGHWRVMNGIMHVVPAGSGTEELTRRESTSPDVVAREFVKDWTFEDLQGALLKESLASASPAAGREVFAEAGCVNCHLVGCDWQWAGPDLAEVSKKYEPGQLLQHILDPSKEVLEEYQFFIYEVEEEADVIGRVVEETDTHVEVLQSLLDPGSLVTLAKDEIIERFNTGISAMPTGLLVTFTEEEIRDLLSYLTRPEGVRADAGIVEASSRVISTPDDPWTVFEGTTGPGKGKHVVLISGDEEYRSEEALPMLARVLAEHHGFKCTVLFSQDKETGVINPEEQTYIPGMEVLKDADMVITFLRFRELPDEDMAHFVNYVESGKPMLGIRTATHAFSYSRNLQSPYAKYHWRSSEWPGGFGRQFLGETWVAHHGHHGQESTRGVIEAQHDEHPVLIGVRDVWGPTDVYAVRDLPADAKVLLRGQVLSGMEPDSAPVDGKKNEPMMPIAWTRELLNESGRTQRVICSTIGASTDCESADLRRLFVNACYWGIGIEDQISAESSVDLVGEYAPTPFGFGSYTRGVRPRDHACK